MYNKLMHLPRFNHPPISSLSLLITLILGLTGLAFLPQQATAYPQALSGTTLLLITLASLLLAIIFILKRVNHKFYFSPLTPFLMILAVHLTVVGVIKYGLIPLTYLLSFAGMFVALATLVLIASALIYIANTKLIHAALLFLSLISALAAVTLLGLSFTPLKIHLPNIFNYFSPPLLINLQVLGLASCLTYFFKKGKLNLLTLASMLPPLLVGLFAAITLNRLNTAAFAPPDVTWQLIKAQLNSSHRWTNIMIGGNGELHEIAQHYLDIQPTAAWQQSYATPLTLAIIAGLPALILFFILGGGSLYLSLQPQNPQRHLYFVFFISWLTCCFTPYYHLLVIIQALLLAAGINKTKYTLLQHPFWAFWRQRQLLSRRLGNLLLAAGVTVYFVIGGWLVTESLLGYIFYHRALAEQKNPQLFAQNIATAHQVAPHADELMRLSAISHLELMLSEESDSELTVFHLHTGINLANGAVKLNPYKVANYLTLSALYQEIHPFLDANNQQFNEKNIIQPLAQAIMLQPYNSKLYQTLADAYLLLGKDQEALDLYQETLKRNPNSLSATFNLGMIYRRLGQNEAARLAFSNALNLLDPQDSNWEKNYQLISEQLR